MGYEMGGRIDVREIILRGKRTDNGKWTYGGYCASDFTGDTYVMDGLIFRLVDPVTVGQYTGLTDKNDKEIFEGDIVRHVDGAGNDIGQIYFDERTASFRRTSKMAVSLLYGYAVGQSCTYEVIGNIHDNPELLEDTT